MAVPITDYYCLVSVHLYWWIERTRQNHTTAVSCLFIPNKSQKPLQENLNPVQGFYDEIEFSLIFRGNWISFVCKHIFDYYRHRHVFDNVNVHMPRWVVGQLFTVTSCGFSSTSHYLLTASNYVINPLHCQWPSPRKLAGLKSLNHLFWLMICAIWTWWMVV